MAIFLFTLSAASTSFAANPTYNMNSTSPFASRVNLYNQTNYTYTVDATYMDQRGAGRHYVMVLNSYPLAGSSILFPITLPEYGVYLKVIRNVDGYLTFSGYLSSDDLYIRTTLKDQKPTVNVTHH